MKRKKKGSLTLEASFVVSLTAIVLGVVISLWIYKYQCCWYTQGMSECLLTGSNQGVVSERDALAAAEIKWRQIKAGNYLVPQNLLADINGDEDELCMKITGKTPLWGQRALAIEIEQKIGIVKPVQFIRKIAALKGAIFD